MPPQELHDQVPRTRQGRRTLCLPKEEKLAGAADRRQVRPRQESAGRCSHAGSMGRQGRPPRGRSTHPTPATAAILLLTAFDSARARNLPCMNSDQDTVGRFLRAFARGFLHLRYPHGGDWTMHVLRPSLTSEWDPRNTVSASCADALACKRQRHARAASAGLFHMLFPATSARYGMTSARLPRVPPARHCPGRAPTTFRRRTLLRHSETRRRSRKVAAMQRGSTSDNRGILLGGN